MAHTLITTHISVHYSISLVNCMLPQPRTNKHTVDVNLVVRWPIRSSDRSSICTLFQLICKLCTIITRAIRTYTISRSAHFTHITLIKRVDPSSYFPYPISRCTHSFSSSHTCSTSHTRYLDVPIHPAHLIHTLLPYSRMIPLAPHSAHVSYTIVYQNEWYTNHIHPAPLIHVVLPYSRMIPLAPHSAHVSYTIVY
jgi:hypothetical protein